MASRNLLCLDCAKEVRSRYKTNEPFPGERIRMMKGALFCGNKICDHCSVVLEQAKECVAYTVYRVDTERSPIFWEGEYMWEMKSF